MKMKCNFYFSSQTCTVLHPDNNLTATEICLRDLQRPICCSTFYTVFNVFSSNLFTYAFRLFEYSPRSSSIIQRLKAFKRRTSAGMRFSRKSDLVKKRLLLSSLVACVKNKINIVNEPVDIRWRTKTNRFACCQQKTTNVISKQSGLSRQ